MRQVTCMTRPLRATIRSSSHIVMVTLAPLTLVFLLLLIVGCSSSPADNTGQTVDVGKPFKRIISLYAAHTENLVYMGATDRIVGVSMQDDLVEVIDLPRFNARDGVEKFLAAKPDLVLMRPMHVRTRPALRKALENAGVTVMALQPSDLDSMFDYWELLGRLCDREERAKGMVRSFRAALSMHDMIARKTVKSMRPKVFFESIHRTMSTFSPDAMPMIVLRAAGGMNVAKDAPPRHNSNIASWGRERLLAHDKTIDVFLAQTGRMNPVTRAMLLDDPAVQQLKAARANKVFTIDEGLVSRPTMNLLVGITTLRKLLYPKTK